MIITFCTILLTTSNVQALNIIQFSTSNPVVSDIICPPTDNCVVQCWGIGACVDFGPTSGSQIKFIYGPSWPYYLLIQVNSNIWPPGTTAATLNMRIDCTDCFYLTIEVSGVGDGEFGSNAILTPLNGLTTLDCWGPAVTGASMGVCHGANFYGEKGFGLLPGQVYIKDVTSIPGRVVSTGIYFNYYCSGSVGGVCVGTKQWVVGTAGAGFLDCVSWAPQAGSCQATHGPTASPPSVAPTTSPPSVAPTTPTQATIPNRINPHPQPFTVSGGVPPGFVAVRKFDYYTMRCSEIIVVIGFFIAIIRTYIGLNKSCKKNKKQYSKVNEEEASDVEN